MLKLQYTCEYLIDETGFLANSEKNATGKRVRKDTVYCSSIKILKTLLERWTRQGFGVYKYTIESEDETYNNEARKHHIDFDVRTTPINSDIAWYGPQQHDFEYIQVRS